MKELHQNLSRLSNWHLRAILHRARWRLLMQRVCLPFPLHFSVVAVLCSFVLLPIMPTEPISIPITIGGGLAGALLLHGR